MTAIDALSAFRKQSVHVVIDTMPRGGVERTGPHVVPREKRAPEAQTTRVASLSVPLLAPR
jgi:hypothetical protein